MKAKEALVKKSAFPKLPASNNIQTSIGFRIAYNQVSKKAIKQALMTQSISKAPRPDKFNFGILYLV